MSRRLNDDWHRIQDAQAYNAAKYAHEQEMKARHTIDLTTGEPLATKAEIAYNLEQLGRHITASTTSNNIDIELREKIKAVPLHWNGKLLEGKNTLGDFFDDGELDVIMSLIAADRDKLIKHLAYEMGENYEAMVKIARTMK